MKLELTIKTTYLPKWGIFEALREFLQNARDAEIEHGAMMKVWHRKDSGVLCIENDGCTVPHEALLFGHTTKIGRSDLAGKFGEGMKLGMLVLTRENIGVKIRSGSEVWTPRIERSEKFDADVLTVHVEKGRQHKNRVQVEITGVGADTYETLKDLFLFLGKVGDDERIRTQSGSLLLGERFKSKLFVKGIFVQNVPDLSFGYDLPDVEIDRDRKMVDSWDRGHRFAQIWREATASRADLIGPYMKLLETEAADVAGVSEWNAGELSAKVKEHVVSEWQKIHGEDAIPVQSLAESQDVEHLGKKGVVVNKPMRHVLEQTLGSVEANKAKLSKETEKLYGWHELSDGEKANLERALFMVAGVEPVALAEVDIADFRDPKLRGLFIPSEDVGGAPRIQLKKGILADGDLTLRVLVHEVAHKAGGGDGEKDHVSNIERIWCGIVAKLTKGDRE